MFRVRESFRNDLEQVLAVAKHLDTVNLPADRDHLEEILDASARSFTGELPAQDREYLFVLEDLETNTVVGTSMIHAQHGTRTSPHIYFDVLTDERYSETLDHHSTYHALRLGYNYNGPTEIGGLILMPEYRRHTEALGRLLSYTRFLFIAMHREVFRDEVLSELLPPLEDDGTSVLWEHLGRRFTGLSYQQADLLSKNNKEFIRALFPHGVIYTSLFPDEVKSVIGVVGPDTKGVEKILRRIGFEYAQQIDPFDGGPHFVAKTDSIPLVSGSAKRVVDVVEEIGRNAAWAIVAAEHSETPAFRAVGTAVVEDDDNIGVSEQVASALGISAGDEVWTVIP
jgi:arginine N-succinyltransferase